MDDFELKRLHEKLDLTVNSINKVEVNVGRIEGHLKELNGRTTRNAQDIEKARYDFNETNKGQDNKIDGLNRFMWAGMGGIGVLSSIAVALSILKILGLI